MQVKMRVYRGKCRLIVSHNAFSRQLRKLSSFTKAQVGMCCDHTHLEQWIDAVPNQVDDQMKRSSRLSPKLRQLGMKLFRVLLSTCIIIHIFQKMEVNITLDLVGR